MLTIIKRLTLLVVPRMTLAVIVLVLLLSQAKAQSTYPTDGSTPMGLKPGAPAGSYSLSGFDNINLFNGNLNFRLPLIGIGGRGGAAHTIMLPIEKKWQVESYTIQGDDWSETHYYPDGDWWEVIGPEYGPGVMHVRYGAHLTRNCTTDGITRAWFSLTRLTFTAPDGTEFELRDRVSGGAKYTVPVCSTSGFNRGRVFVTADGTSATFISDSNIVDLHLSDGSGGETNQYVSGYLMLNDGTRYRIDNGYVTWIRDRNGNKISFSYMSGQVTTITDSLNRQITIAYNVQDVFPYGLCDKITFKGFSGATRVIRISKTSMGNVLRSGYSLQSLANLFPNLEGSSSGTFNPTVISDVWLPNDQRYQFRYNSYAELARIVLPTGGAVEFDHGTGWSSGTDVGGTINVGAVWAIYRRVLERREYADGTNLTNKLTYGRYVLDPGLTTGTVLVDQRNAGGTLLGRQKHCFYGIDPGESIATQTPVKYPAWDEGKEYQTESFDFNGTTVLRRVNHVWQGNGTMGGLTVNARIVETTSTVEPSGANLVSKQTFTHDQYNNQTNVYEYDFGSGSAGALVRRTQTTYVTTNNGYDYACDPASTCNASAVIGNVIHLRSLTSQVSVYDAGGTERARSTSEYDNYTTDANHAALVNRVSISGLDAAFTTSFTPRGNATATTRYLLSGGVVTGSISAFAQYDIAGNVVKSIDGRGFATLIDFTDRFGSPDGEARLNSAPLELSTPGQASYAFGTLATNALGHTAYTQIDYYLGRPVEVEDANGIVSSGYFNDVLDRPTQVVVAVNNASVKSQTTFSYDDLNRIVTSTSDLNSYNDNLLMSQSLYDNLGRTFESRQYEGGTNYIATKRNYDALGRAKQISNPYRPWQSESPVWMTTTFDALGRTVTATTSDNSVVTTSYSGNTVTATDQIGKQRKSVTDALGRLKEIYEDPTGLNYLTSYSYDVLDNLITVTQGSQTRTFVYDSFKRLTSATNPESGTSTYQYDNNGNLTQRTDARSITTTIVYDALNRPTSKTYQNDPAATPVVSYFYDSQTLPGGAPTYSRGYATGRLVAVTYGTASSAGDYHGFDALGRSLVKIQQIGGINYQVSAAYNRGGAITSQTYPSGRTVNYSYDNAGRMISVSGYLGDGINRTYSTGIVYSSLGGLAKEQFGTDTPIYNKSFYNSRGQLSEIRVSSSYTGPTDTTWNRGAIINHYSNQCWGACNGTDNNGNLKKQEIFIPLNDQLPTTSWTSWYQQFDYDNLNRLQRVHEYTGNPSVDWQQEYVYDRYGNRTIHQTNSWGIGINKKDFTVNTANNRLGVPAGQSGTMTYDAAGNLTNDTYTGAGSRVYDAENRMTKAWGGYNQWQEYTYDAGGQRVRRKVDGVEAWQVYGIGGELLAEYPASGAPASPKKEYGYRNGQLLVTATSPVTTGAGLQAQYFDTMNFTDLKLTRTDATVNFDWASSSPDPSLGADTFTVRWQGKVEPQYSQTYTFYTHTDDGVRLWVNGQLLINKWVDQGPTEWSGSIALTAGQRYDIVMESYENGGGAMAKLSWSSASQPKQIIPQSRLYLPGSSSQMALEFLVTDQLGTPRMVFDKSGSLAATKRHDYLPFGEELYANQGVRTSGLGYNGDAIRQKFTGYERDAETGLDYARARYCSSSQGRFTSPDPLMASARSTDPQTWNRYAYVGNSPVVFSDPSGLSRGPAGMYSSIRSLDGPPASRGNNTILEEAQAEYERSLTDTLAAIEEADSINQQLQKGKITRETAIERAEKNPMLEVVTQQPTQQELVKSGTVEAAKRLEIEPCGNFFGGTEKGVKTLNSLNFSVDADMDPSGHPQAELKGSNVSVNPYRGSSDGGGLVTPDGVPHPYIVMDPKTNKISVITLYGVEARAFGALHETGHKGKRFGNTDNDSGGHVLNSYRNNFKIWKACFGGVPSQPWRGQPPIIK